MNEVSPSQIYEDLFYKRLTELRMKKGISARRMSLLLAQEDGYINKIEARKITPSLHSFFRICEFLEVTPKEFYDEQLKHPALYHLLMEDLKHVDEEILANLAAIVKRLKKAEEK